RYQPTTPKVMTAAAAKASRLRMGQASGGKDRVPGGRRAGAAGRRGSLARSRRRGPGQPRSGMTNDEVPNDERSTKPQARRGVGRQPGRGAPPDPFRHWGFVLLSSLGTSSFVIPEWPQVSRRKWRGRGGGGNRS